MTVCLYEGYLRNRKALCRELCVDPRSSRDETEREILLKGYARWGRALPEHLQGGFAFALRDRERRELFCARDPLGLRPFWYCRASSALLFGTDLDAVVKDPRYEPGIDPEALQIYMMFGYPAGGKTLYRGVVKLMPGHCLVYGENGLDVRPYTRLAFAPDYGPSEEEWAEEIDRTMQEILADDRENFDFSRGVSFLSGGVDSSWLLASSGVRTALSVGYGEAGASETQLAAETAARLGVRLLRTEVTSGAFFGAVPGVVRGLGLPLADASSVVFALGCRDAAKEAAFCFSGEGADEFFAGYHLYRRAEELARTGGEWHYGCAGVMPQAPALALLGMEQGFPCERLVEGIYRETEGGERLSRLLKIDLSLWLEGDILFSVNRAARANGLEILLPYADPRMFALSARIPSALKLRDGCGKYILRKAALKRLPYETAFRQKVGFSVPVREWMRKEEHLPEIREVLFGEASRDFFDRKLLAGYWDSLQAGNTEIWQIPYAAYVFLVWYETCFLNHSGPDYCPTVI